MQIYLPVCFVYVDKGKSCLACSLATPAFKRSRYNSRDNLCSSSFLPVSPLPTFSETVRVLPCRFSTDCKRHSSGAILCVASIAFEYRVEYSFTFCGSMTNPLSPTIHRNPYVKLDFTHLKWGRVLMSHQIPNKSTILMYFSRTRAV